MEKSSTTLIRVLSLILVFLLGFLTCAGAILAGGYFVFSKISYDKLAEWGIVEKEPEFVNAEAEVPFTSLTLEKLISELSELSALESKLTLDYMIERYGVILPEELDELLPTEVRELPLNEVFGENGMQVFLENVTVDTVLKFVPADVISEPARATLGTRTLAEVVEGDMGYLLEGVHIGYLVGVEYNRTEDGQFEVVYANQDEPTLFELIAPLDLGKTLTVMSDGGNMLEVMHDCLGEVMVRQVVEAMMESDSELMNTLLAGKTFSEIITYDEEVGTYILDTPSLFEGKRVGDLLGYTPIYLEGTEGVEGTEPIIIGWMEGEDDEQKEVLGYMRGVAGATLENFGTDEFDFNTLLDGVYFGDMFAYRPVYLPDGTLDHWETKDGGEIDRAFKNISMKSIDELSEEGFTFASLFGEDDKLGYFLGYERIKTKEDDPDTEVDESEYKWYSESETEPGVYDVPVEGLDTVIADIELAKLFDTDSEYSIADEFDGVELGEILGYEKVIITEDDPATTDVDETECIWYESYYGENDEKNVEVSGMDKVISGIDLGKLFDEDSDYSVSDEFKGTALGELLDYEKNEKGEWCENVEGVLTPVTAMESAMADIDLGRLFDSEDDYEIADAFDDTYLGDMMGEDYVRGEWIEDDPNTETDESGYAWYEYSYDAEGNPVYQTDEDGNPVYETDAEGNLVLDQNGDPVKVRATEKVTELISKFANYNIGAIIKGEQQINQDELTEGVTIAELYNFYSVELPAYTPDGDIIYALDDEGNPTEEQLKVVIWYDSDTKNPVGGILSALANSMCDDLDNSLNAIEVGSILGYVEYNGEWYEKTVKRDEFVTLSLAEGMMRHMSNLRIDQLNNNEDVSDAIQNVTVAEAMNWTEGEDGAWYDSEGVKVTGVLGAVAGSTIGNLNEDIDNLEIGKVLGYEKNADGVWVDENDAPIDGIMRAIADYKVNELDEKIGTILIGDVVGWYKKNVGTETEPQYEWYTDAEFTTPAEGIMLSFANLTVDDLSDNDKVTGAVKNLTVGEAMGFELVDNVWYESYTDATENTPATGIMKEIAGMKVGELNDPEKGIDTILIGSVLNWYQDEDGEWYTDADFTAPAEGIMLSFADLSIADMKEAEKVEAATATLKVGVAMGWTYDEDDGIWYTDKEQTIPATGIMKSVAPLTVGELDTEVDKILLGTIMGWTEVDGVWYNAGGEVATGMMLSFAGLSVGELSNDKTVTDVVKGLKVGDAMGWTYDEDADIWYTSEPQLDENGDYVYDADGKQLYKEAKGIMETVASMTVEQIGRDEDGVNSIRIGTIMGWKQQGTKEDPLNPGTQMDAWVDETGNEPKGIMKHFANLTVGEMSDETKVSGVVDHITVADALHLSKNDEGEYVHKDGTAVSGLIAAIADTHLANIEEKINHTVAGDLLEYIYFTDVPQVLKPVYDDEGNLVTDENGNVVTKISDISVDDWYYNVIAENVTLADAKDEEGNVIPDVYEVTIDGSTVTAGFAREYFVIPNGDGTGTVLKRTSTLDESIAFGDNIGWWYSKVTFAYSMETIQVTNSDGTVYTKFYINHLDEQTGEVLYRTALNGINFRYVEGVLYERTQKLGNKVASTEIGELGTTMANLTVGEMLNYTDDQHAVMAWLLEDDHWEKETLQEFFNRLTNGLKNLQEQMEQLEAQATQNE